MSEKEKTVATAIVKALEKLPEHKQEYFKGYAEGIEIATRKDDAPAKPE